MLSRILLSKSKSPFLILFLLCLLFLRQNSDLVSTGLPETVSLVDVSSVSKNVGQESERGDVERKREEVHVTHFFSSYSVSPQSTSHYEQKIVQNSWKIAAENAKRSGINVEFIDATLPDDTGMSPPFAVRYNLERWIRDIQKGRVPTVGEPFEIASKKGQGKVLVYTNCDIGVMPEFYIKVYDWATRDYSSQTAQIDAIKRTSQYVASCLLDDHLDAFNSELCLEDAKVFYVHSGGFLELWDDVVKDIALSAVGYWQSKTGREILNRVFFDLMKTLLPSMEFEAFSTRYANSKTWRSLAREVVLTGPDPIKLSKFKNVPFAGTITRVEVDYSIAKEASKGVQGMYKDVLKLIPQTGEKHPGNDCFVFMKSGLPDAVKYLGHPPGIRPFGQWIAQSWWFSGVPFRRIGGTRDNPWTFHVGRGVFGLDADGWKERAMEDEAYTLFLAANFDRLSNHALRAMFNNGPKICREITSPWRSSDFCKSVPDDFCAGVVRYSCYYSANMELRDPQVYFKLCYSLHKRNQGKYMQPICGFCNFLFELEGITKKRFTCEEGRLPFCEGLGNVTC